MATSSKPRPKWSRSSSRKSQPLLIGKDAFNIEGCWEAMRSRATISCATASSPCARRPRRQRAVGRRRQGAGDAALQALGRLQGSAPGHLHRRPLRGRQTLADFGREMEQIRATGYAGCKFKVGGRTPKEDAARVRAASERRRRRFHRSWSTQTRAGHLRACGRRFRAMLADLLEHPLVRGTGALVQ